MSYQKHLENIKSINDQFRYYKTVESLFELDQWSALPLEGGAYRQQVAAHIAAQKAGLFDSEDAKNAEEYFKAVNLNEIEDYVERGLIRSFLFRYGNQTRTPKDLMHEYSMLRADTMNKWKEAREKQDFEVTYLPVDANGQVKLEELQRALRKDTILVSIMHTNNEIGSLQPIAEAGEIIKRFNPSIVFHVDAVQGYGKFRIQPKKMNIDLLPSHRNRKA